MNTKIFRAYDIRGEYPNEINEETVFLIAKHLPKIFKGKVVIGHDDRLSSPAIYKSLLKALKSSPGIKVIDAGTITTPMLYFLVNDIGAIGGVMVTASHNPEQYNGLKIVGKNAKPISGLEILKIISG